MRAITLSQFIPIYAIYGFNSIIYILFLINFQFVHLYFLTTWTYWMNSIYLFLVLVCDISLFATNSDRFEKMNSFLRNSYCIVSMSFSYAVVILFWSLSFLGESFMRLPKNTLETIFNYYLHGGNTIFVIIDLFLSEHKKCEFTYKYILIISGIYWFYFAVAAFAKYVNNFSPYTFMENATFGQLVVASIIMYIIVFNAYQIHLFFIKMKYKYKIHIDKSYEDLNNVRGLPLEKE